MSLISPIHATSSCLAQAVSKPGPSSATGRPSPNRAAPPRDMVPWILLNFCHPMSVNKLLSYAFPVALFLAALPLFSADKPLPVSLIDPKGWCTKEAANALASLAALHPADTNALAETLIATGAALELADETAAAASLYQQAMLLARDQIKITGVKTEPPLRAYINALIHLGGLEYSKSHYEEAEKLYRSAVEAARIRFSENDPLVKVARNRYALALGQRYQMEKHRAFYLVLKESCVKAFGKRHEETARVLDELVDVEMLRADYKQAAVFAKEALLARRRTLRSDHPLVADSINRLASAYYSLGQRAELAPLLKEALKIRSAAFGPEHPKTALSRKNLELAIEE